MQARIEGRSRRIVIVRYGEIKLAEARRRARELLALTGCRRSEVLNPRWLNVGADALNPEDSKTDQRAVPLGEVPRVQIEAMPGERRFGGVPVPALRAWKGLRSLVQFLARDRRGREAR